MKISDYKINNKYMCGNCISIFILRSNGISDTGFVPTFITKKHNNCNCPVNFGTLTPENLKYWNIIELTTKAKILFK